MTDLIKKWTARQIDLGSFNQRAAVYRFAVKMSFLTIILSMLFSVLVMPLIRVSGLLPMTLTIAEAVSLAVAVSWLVGGCVSGVLAVITGYAIYDLSASRAEFEHLSRTDMLSGLLNRRAFSEVFDRTHDDASLVIFDVDRFKAINDHYGHAAGDRVIATVAAILSAVFPAHASIGRLGGEEFGVILPGGLLHERRQLVDLACRQIAAASVVADGHMLSVTISGGIADFWKGRRQEVVYSAADKALYLAKAAGRNRVVHEGDGISHGSFGHFNGGHQTGHTGDHAEALRAGGAV